MSPVPLRIQGEGWTWTPIDRNRTEFRLLHLIERGEGDQYLHCRVEHFPLSRPPPYVALSWTWGDHLPEHYRLCIEDRWIQIPETLFEALLVLEKNGHRTIWVDALCVDQTNIDEKAVQVLRMATVFGQADLVAVWLGKAEEGSSDMMDMFSSPENAKYSLSIINDPALRSGWKKAAQLARFLQRPYWRRVWIVQEIVVAKRVVIFCGEKSADGSVFEDLFNDDSKSGIATFGKYYDMNYLDAIWRTRKNRKRRLPVSLLELLYQTSLCLATDLLDKVYALLGLGFDSSFFVSEPDYTMSLRELCISMSKNVICLTQNLDYVFLADLNSDKDSELPSWCPNYLQMGRDSRLSHFSLAYYGDFSLNKPNETNAVVKYLSGQDNFCGFGQFGSRWNATLSSPANFTILTEPVGHLRVATHYIGSIHVVSGSMATPSSNYVSSNQVGKRSRSRIEKKNSEFFHDLAALFSVYQPKYFEALQESRDWLLFKWYREQMMRKVGMPDSDPGRGPINLFWNGQFDLPFCGPSLLQRTADLVLKFHGKQMDGAIESAFDFKYGRMLTEGARLITTFEGHVGWAYGSVQADDEIHLIPGCSMPVILRPCEASIFHSKTYRYIGRSVLTDCMNGEVWKDIKEEDLVPIFII